MLHLPDARPTLIDGDLVLRPWQLADADAVYEACQDPIIQMYTTVPVPYTREHAEAFVTSRASLPIDADLGCAMVWQGQLAG